MNKIQAIYDEAVKRFGRDQVGGLCNCHGGFDGQLGTVPQANHDRLAGVLKRMMGNARAVAQARADFATINEAKAKAKREPSKPTAIDAQMVQDVYRRWNASTADAD